MTPKLLGIVNITEDSFSDGGRFLDTSAAIAHARSLAVDGADVIDVGAAASNPAAKPVPHDKEIARLAPVIEVLRSEGYAISVDSFSPHVQRWALAQGVDYLNDVQGFPDPALYPELAVSRAKLIVMHAVQGRGRAEKIDIAPATIMDRIRFYFEQRIAALTKAGVVRERLVLDPGMGFFIGTNPETSLTVLRRLPELKAAFGLPMLVSVSRKSFLRSVTGCSVERASAATLAAELFAARIGADYIRTHDPAALRDGLVMQKALAGKDSEA